MKLNEFLLAMLIAAGSLRAQVGIGTKNPQSMLDVKGNITIGFEENNPGKKGMLRWSDANTCFEGHDGENWKCLEYKLFSNKEALVKLSGGDAIAYDNDKGWKDSDQNHPSNIVKLNVTGGTDQSLYENGIFTVKEEGVYELVYKIALLIKNVKGNFDGIGGNFYSWITKNNSIYGPKHQMLVIRGASPADKMALYEHHDNQIIYLRKGETLNVRFGTFNARHMNDNTNEITFDKGHSHISLWKLY